MFEYVYETAGPESLTQNGMADMLRDTERNEKYFRAIKAAVELKHSKGEKAIVLDIGTGTSLLSLMAIRAGADSVYACEEAPIMIRCAKAVISQNGCDRKIKLIDKMSTSLTVGRGKDIPQLANILVTEIFASYLLFERAIETIADARRRLLTKDAIIIPQKTILYGQVVECDYIAQMSTIKPILLPNGTKIEMPEEMATCSSATTGNHDIQLSALPRNSYKRLSNGLPIFEFVWSQIENHQGQIRTGRQSFICNVNGEANAVFSWWDLYLDGNEENVLSLRPTSDPEAAWRMHWMQTVHFGQNVMKLHEGNECWLEGFRDTTDHWFRVTREGSPSADIPDKLICTCSMHALLTGMRVGALNDKVMLDKYIEAMQSILGKGERICLSLSEAEGSILHLIAAKIGNQGKIFMIDNTLKTDVPHCVLANLKLLAKNEVQIYRVGTHPTQLDMTDFQMQQVDIVLGDPFFGKLDMERPYMPPKYCLTLFQHFQSHQFPWHHLLFGRYLDSMRANGVLSPEARIMPIKGVLMGVAVNFENLHMINAPVREIQVCGETFNLRGFEDRIQKLAVGEGRLDCQQLWQYPGSASCTPFEIMEFDFTSYLESKRCTKNIVLEENANGVALWMDWHLTPEIVVSSGPTAPVVVGEQIHWDMYCTQGVFYIWEKCKDNLLHTKVGFNSQDHCFDFNFS